MIRRLRASDQEALGELAGRELTRDPYAEQIPRILTQLDHVGFVAEEKSALIGCCLGSKSRFGDDHDAHLDLIVVDRAHRRLGIGRRMLEHLEAELAGDGCARLRIEGNAPCYAWAGVDVHYTPALCFVESQGFVRGRSALNMNVDLSADFDTGRERAALARDGILIHRGTIDDEATLNQLASTWRPRWIAQLRLALTGVGSAVYFAHRGEACVGFGAFGVNRVHEIGPLGTDAEVRGRGIGRVLLRLCCEEQRRLGLDRAELRWAGPYGYFSDVLQATTGRVFWLYHKDLVGQPSPGPRLPKG